MSPGIDVPAVTGNTDILSRSSSFGALTVAIAIRSRSIRPETRRRTDQGRSSIRFCRWVSGCSGTELRWESYAVAHWNHTHGLGETRPWLRSDSPFFRHCLLHIVCDAGGARDAAYAGNLWSWMPQVRVEHRFAVSENSHSRSRVDSDPLSEKTPLAYSNSPCTIVVRRQENSRVSLRLCCAHRMVHGLLFGQQATIGAGGYYSRQTGGFGRNVNA